MFVDDTLKAYIISYTLIDNVAYYNLKYIVGNYIEKNVCYDRIKACNVASESHNRSELVRITESASQSSAHSQISTSNNNMTTPRPTARAVTTNTAATQMQQTNSSPMRNQSSLYIQLKEAVSDSFKFHTTADAVRMSSTGTNTSCD